MTPADLFTPVIEHLYLYSFMDKNTRVAGEKRDLTYSRHRMPRSEDLLFGGHVLGFHSGLGRPSISVTRSVKRALSVDTVLYTCEPKHVTRSSKPAFHTHRPEMMKNLRKPRQLRRLRHRVLRKSGSLPSRQEPMTWASEERLQRERDHKIIRSKNKKARCSSEDP